MKKFIALFLSSSLIFSSNIKAFADEKEDINIVKFMEIQKLPDTQITSPNNINLDKRHTLIVNGNKIELKEGAIIYENRLFLPIRELSDALNIDIEYLENEKIVSLDDGDIQLPIGRNKAIVDDEIVPIDKNNNKVGTLVLNDKTYLPVSFIASNLKNVSSLSYQPETKTTTISIAINKDSSLEEEKILTKEEAIKVYQDLLKVSNEMKNVTSISKVNVNLDMSDDTTNINMIMNTEGTTYVDIKDKFNMYSEQKSKASFMGETQEIEQKMFYQDGKVYISQKANGQELKYKMDLDLEKFMEMSKGLNLDPNFLKNMVLEGKYKKLDDNKTQYNFMLDMSKSLDLPLELIKSLNLDEKTLQTIKDLKMDNVNYVLIVNDKNEPISQNLSFNMSFKQDKINAKAKISCANTYENIGSTVIKIPDEDFSQYKDFNNAINNK